MGKFWAWFHRWWNAEDRTQDVKLASFFMVVVWASFKLAFTKITGEWVDAFYGLCALVGLGGTAWAAVDRWKGGKGATQTTTQPGSKDQEGGNP